MPTPPELTPIALVRDPFDPMNPIVLKTTLQFIGTITTEQDTWALITTANQLTHKFTLGDEIMPHSLRIIQITPCTVTLFNSQQHTQFTLSLNKETA